MWSSSMSLLPLALLMAISEATSQTNHVVTVGKGSQLKFDPEILKAGVGDTITYQFFAKNHAVSQSSFNEPCQPLAGGFFSGFTPNNSTDVASPTTFTITVNDTKPIWIYCPQTNGDHCQKGMVHSINAPDSGNTFEAYKEKATKAPTPSKSPADGFPVGGLRLLKVVVAPGGSLVFSPNNITELPGTVVQFGFNPKNHSVTQSNFADPCHPLDKGFNSGFIPTALSPSGVTFDIIVKDTQPVWFYCAQTTGDHCQTGMVGSINAPAEGNTLQAFIELAKKASMSTIGPEAPVKGVLSVNGTQVSSFDGDKPADKPSEDGNLDGGDITYVPPPGTNTSSEVWNMAGGGQPDSYNWAPTISDNATSFLQLIELLDNVLLTVLIAGLEKLDADNGEWKHTYPESIVKIINAISAQALVHRATATDSLQHYGKPLSQTCNYTIPIDTVDEWLNTALAVLLLEIGVLIDVTTITAPTDPWLVPALVTEVGAKSRMTAVISLMQGHIAAAAPREAMLPAALGWSYATSHWLTNCQGSPPKGLPDKPYPVLEVVSTVKDNERTSKVTFKLGSDWSKQGKLWVAWVGEWGTLRLTVLGDDGSADVPAELYGHVWAVIVSGRPGKVNELGGMTVAGPALVWVDQP